MDRLKRQIEIGWNQDAFLDRNQAIEQSGRTPWHGGRMHKDHLGT